LPSIDNLFPAWLTQCMDTHQVPLWGTADLRNFATPVDENGKRFPFALSWALPMNPRIMASIQSGPNQPYADEYERVNHRINQLAATLAAGLGARGYHAKPLAASERTDAVAVKGEFPHKTAATRAGLGWIGRHCQLITHRLGSWVRLGTVFTDMALPCGPAVERHFCGQCTQCVDACPAKALTGTAWQPGVPRRAMLDVQICDQWKKEHYCRYHHGHICGICSAVCPYGLKSLKKEV